MQQLTIFASPDLEQRIVSALANAHVDGYVSLGPATAHRFNDREDLPRTTDWEAWVFVVPAAEASSIRAIVEALEAYAESCETRPCLRLVVTPVEMTSADTVGT